MKQKELNIVEHKHSNSRKLFDSENNDDEYLFRMASVIIMTLRC